jgi:hypothetical protein
MFLSFESWTKTSIQDQTIVDYNNRRRSLH